MGISTVCLAVGVLIARADINSVCFAIGVFITRGHYSTVCLAAGVLSTWALVQCVSLLVYL